MLTTRAFPDYQRAYQEADEKMVQCRKLVSPGYITQRLRQTLS
jgi:hypothetical protein